MLGHSRRLGVPGWRDPPRRPPASRRTILAIFFFRKSVILFHVEIEPLEASLISFDGPSPAPGADPIEQLRAALDAVIVRAQNTAVRLEEQDSVARSRQAYVAAILRMLDYLLMTPTSMDAAGKQAAVALGYIRHIETSRLAALQIGRTVRDEKLTVAVQTMRQQLADLAEKRSAVKMEAKERAQLRLAKGAK